MTGTASSSPWVDSESKNAGSAREPATRGKVHYFFLQRQSTLRLVLPAAITALMLLALTFGLHSVEILKYSDSERRLGHYILLALAAIPIWYKLPISIPLIAEAISTAIAWYVFCNDDYPDFSISPHSIWGLAWMKHRRFCWSQIERVEIVRVKRTGWFSGNRPPTSKLFFYTSAPMSLPIIGSAWRLNHTIVLSKGFSESDKDKIIELVCKYAPDKPVVQTSQIINSQF